MSELMHRRDRSDVVAAFVAGAVVGLIAGPLLARFAPVGAEQVRRELAPRANRVDARMRETILAQR